MIQAFCWVLIHSLWQGLLFTALTGIVMLYTKRASAAIRYNCLCGLFFLFLAVCGATFLWEWAHSGGDAIGLQYLPLLSGGGISSFLRETGDYFTTHASLVVLGWGIVFAAKCVKMAASLVWVQRIRHYGAVMPPEGWRNKLSGYCEQLQIKKTVGLLESRLVKVPMVVGHLRPLIFIPLGLLTRLPAGEIEAVLLHELAHIRRNDYFVNFLQNIAENIFFFNPGLLWISSLLRDERENCCDDIALSKTGNKLQFIQALVSFKEHAINGNGMALAFPARKDQLLRRVTRIAYGRDKTMKPAEKIFFLTSCCLIGLLVATTRDLPVKTAGMSEGRVLYAGKRTDNITGEWGSGGRRGSEREDIAPENELADSREEGVAVPGRPDEPKDVADDADQAREAAVQAEQDRQQALNDAEQAREDKVQAERDAEEARQDKVQAEEDRKQADLDRIQADLDRQERQKEAEQARTDKVQAERDAQADRVQAKGADGSHARVDDRSPAREDDRVQEDKVREVRVQAERVQTERVRADKIEEDRVQTERGVIPARMEKIQVKKVVITTTTTTKHTNPI